MWLLTSLALGSDALHRDVRNDVLESGVQWVVRDADGQVVPADEIARRLDDADAQAEIEVELQRARRRGRRQAWVGVGITGAGLGLAAAGAPIGERPANVLVLVGGVTVAAIGPAWAAAGVMSVSAGEAAALEPARYWTASEMDALLEVHNAE